MSTRKELAWWIAFAQTDLSNMGKKRKNIVLSELTTHVHFMAFTDIETKIMPEFTWEEVLLTQEGAQSVVNAILDENAPMPEGKYTVHEKMEGLDSNRHLSLETGAELGRVLALQALRQAEIETDKLFGSCIVCGDLFLQASLKRDKMYCSPKCRTKKHRDLAKKAESNERKNKAA